MDISGEVADLMVKESIQLTEASIKLLAEGSKNLTALLWALAKDSKKLVGKTGMARLIQEGKELKAFRIKESDLEEFKQYAKKNVLFAAIKDNRATDGMVDLVTNIDFVSQVNLFMEKRGYVAPVQSRTEPRKKADSLAQPDNSSPQRGSGSTVKRTQPTRRTTDGADKPSVREKLDRLKAETKEMPKPTVEMPQMKRTKPTKTH